MAMLDRVRQARKDRDEAREEAIEAQEYFVAAILAAAASGASLREIAEYAGVSFQRVGKIIQREGGAGVTPD